MDTDLVILLYCRQQKNLYCTNHLIVLQNVIQTGKLSRIQQERLDREWFVPDLNDVTTKSVES